MNETRDEVQGYCDVLNRHEHRGFSRWEAKPYGIGWKAVGRDLLHPWPTWKPGAEPVEVFFWPQEAAILAEWYERQEKPPLHPQDAIDAATCFPRRMPPPKEKDA
jgi:hypothetical protein